MISTTPKPDMQDVIAEAVRAAVNNRAKLSHQRRCDRIVKRYGFLIEPWGDDGDWLATWGHVDLDAFSRQAVSRALRSCGWGWDPEDIPRDEVDPQHAWVVIEKDEYDEEVYRPCSAETPGAVAVTMTSAF